MTVQRLQGFGFGLAPKTIVVQNIDELPICPENNSYLVIPQINKSFLTSPQAKNWAKIFLLTNNLNNIAESSRVIFVTNNVEPWMVWQKILAPLRGINKNLSSVHSWHSIPSIGSCKLNTLVDEIGQTKPFSSVLTHSSMVPLLSQLADLPSGQSMSQVSYSVYVDSNTLKLQISMDDNDKELLAQFMKIAVAGPYDSQLWHNDHKILFSASINFNSIGESCRSLLVDVSSAPCVSSLSDVEEAS